MAKQEIKTRVLKFYFNVHPFYFLSFIAVLNKYFHKKKKEVNLYAHYIKAGTFSRSNFL